MLFVFNFKWIYLFQFNLVIQSNIIRWTVNSGFVSVCPQNCLLYIWLLTNQSGQVSVFYHFEVWVHKLLSIYHQFGFKCSSFGGFFHHFNLLRALCLWNFNLLEFRFKGLPLFDFWFLVNTDGSSKFLEDLLEFWVLQYSFSWLHGEVCAHFLLVTPEWIFLVISTMDTSVCAFVLKPER